MFSWKDFKNKTWLDWVKIIVAIDIAAVGIALILGFDAHILAFMFGIISRIIFGVLYMFVAYIIFKQVFPDDMDAEEQRELSKLDKDILSTVEKIKQTSKDFFRSSKKFADEAYDEIDDLLEQGGEYLEKQTHTVTEKVNRLRKK